MTHQSAKRLLAVGLASLPFITCHDDVVDGSHKPPAVPVERNARPFFPDGATIDRQYEPSVRVRFNRQRNSLQLVRSHLVTRDIEVVPGGLWRFEPQVAPGRSLAVNGRWKTVRFPSSRPRSFTLRKGQQSAPLSAAIGKNLTEGLFYFAASVNGRWECSMAFNSAHACQDVAIGTPPPGAIPVCLPGRGARFIQHPGMLSFRGTKLSALCRTSGFLRARVTRVSGTRHGLTQAFYETGELQAEIQYHRGRIHGLLKTYRRNGRLRSVVPYARGRRNGTAKGLHESGSVAYLMPFVQGIQEGTRKEFFSDGRLRAVQRWSRGCPSGPRTEFNKKGEVVRALHATCSPSGVAYRDVTVP